MTNDDRLLASARFQRPWYLPISKEYSISSYKMAKSRRFFQFQINDIIIYPGGFYDQTATSR